MPAVRQYPLAQVSLPQMPSSALPHPALPIAFFLAFPLAAPCRFLWLHRRGQRAWSQILHTWRYTGTLNMDVQDSLKRIAGLSQDPRILLNFLAQILNADRCTLSCPPDSHCLINVEALTGNWSESQAHPSYRESKFLSCRLRLSCWWGILGMYPESEN